MMLVADHDHIADTDLPLKVYHLRTNPSGP